MDRANNQSDNFIAYLAATAPALFQLIAVLSVGLSNVLNINEFVFMPEFLNIANLFVVLFTLTLITISSWWDANKFSLKFNPHRRFDPSLFPKTFWKYLKISVTLSILCGLIFLIVILNKPILTTYTSFWSTIQWLSYILSLTLISYAIYIFVLLKIQERRSRALYDNFVPRLMDSLRKYGYVTDPDIIVQSINREQLTAVVIINKMDVYKVDTTYEGEMVSIQKLPTASPSSSRSPVNR